MQIDRDELTRLYVGQMPVVAAMLLTATDAETDDEDAIADAASGARALIEACLDELVNGDVNFVTVD